MPKTLTCSHRPGTCSLTSRPGSYTDNPTLTILLPIITLRLVPSYTYSNLHKSGGSLYKDCKEPSGLVSK